MFIKNKKYSIIIYNDRRIKMSVQKIKYLFDNWENFTWEEENYNDLIAYLKNVDLNTLDLELQQKVKDLLAQEEQKNGVQISNDLVQQTSNDTEIVQNTEIDDSDQEMIIDIPNASLQDQIQNEIVANQEISINHEIPIESQPTEPDSNNILVDSKDSSKKKKNNQLLIIFIIVIILSILGIVGYFMYTGTIPNPFFKESNNLLSCSLSEHDNTFKAELSSKIDMKFDKNNAIDTIDATISYVFDDQETYDTWKQMYSKQDSQNNTSNFAGMSGKNEFDDKNKTLKLIIQQKYSEIPEENKSKDFPSTFDEAKKYYLNQGYTCNGEKGNINQTDGNNQSNLIGELISVTEKINVTNSLFEYKNYEWEYDATFSEDSAFIWMGTLKNITDKKLEMNIHLKFYDENKQLIGEYQHDDTNGIDESDDTSEAFILEPNDIKNPSFTIYSNDLYEGYSIQKVAYISVEDIVFETNDDSE